MNKKKFLLLSGILITCFLMQFPIFADDQTEEKSEEEIANENKNKEIEKTAVTDSDNLNFYPKLQLITPSLFTGAANLKGNEVFLRAGVISFFPDSQNTSSSYMTPSLSFGWGVTDWLFFSGTVPYKYYFGQTNNFSDPWLNLKLKILTEPFILSLQLDGKIPYGKASGTTISGTTTSTSLSFGDGQADAGAMILATKYFEPVFLQAGGGYKYRFQGQTLQNNNVVSMKYADQIGYVFDIGINFPFFNPMTFDISAYGYVPFGSYTVTDSNYLAIRPNLTYKFSNWDANLSFNKVIMGQKTDLSWGIYGGATIKTFFEYPVIFTLLLLPKSDAEMINKREIPAEFETGKQLYINHCSKCHVMLAPDAYSTEKWQPVISRYRQKKIISKAEEKAIIDFIEKYSETK